MLGANEVGRLKQPLRVDNGLSGQDDSPGHVMSGGNRAVGLNKLLRVSSGLLNQDTLPQNDLPPLCGESPNKTRYKIFGSNGTFLLHTCDHQRREIEVSRDGWRASVGCVKASPYEYWRVQARIARKEEQRDRGL